MNETGQKKIAMINSMAGYGRCSLTAAIPVISALGIQCCPVVTSILSNHTGYQSCYFDDYTERMVPYMDEWKKQGFAFDSIATGFLGSVRQVQIVADFISHFKQEGTKLLVDPVLGDNGSLYCTCTPELCEEMRELIQYADVITPNLTEACVLTETPWREKGWSRRELSDLAYKLLFMGPGAVVLTGVEKGHSILNVVLEKGREPVFLSSKYVESRRHGTGDVFSAVTAALMVRGFPLTECVKKAASFTRKCVERSEELQIPEKEGLCIEECLPSLLRMAGQRTKG